MTELVAFSPLSLFRTVFMPYKIGILEIGGIIRDGKAGFPCLLPIKVELYRLRFVTVTQLGDIAGDIDSLTPIGAVIYDERQIHKVFIKV